MSKYIDAEKLIKAIEEKGIDNLALIGPLQQDQPSNEDDGKFVKISVRKEFAEQFQRLRDKHQALQSSFIRAMNQQKQPELEKEFSREYATYHLPGFILETLSGGTEVIDFIYKTARHFYELGKNARKEE